MDFNLYQARLSASGTSNNDAYQKATIDLINYSFKDSPYYTVVKIDDVDTEVRVEEGKDATHKVLLLRPNTVKQRGSIVRYSGYDWMITDSLNTDNIFPKVMMQLCNQIVTINQRVFPCIISQVTVRSFDISYVKVPELKGSFYMYVPFNGDTAVVKEQDRFKFFDRTYEVKGVDGLTYIANGVGMLQIIIELTTGHTGDVIDNNNKPQNGGLW